MLNLQQFRTRVKGLPDLLPYAWPVADGVLILKSGALTSTLKYRGPDLDSAEDYEMNALSQQLNHALKQLGTGWMLQFDACRRPATEYPTSEFPHPVLTLIDQERAQLYARGTAHYVSEYYLTVTFLPDSDQASKFGEFFINRGAKGATETQAVYARHLTNYQVAVQQLMDRLVMLRPTKLDANEQLAHIWECISGIQQPVRTPKGGMPLDFFLGAKDLRTGHYPKVGDNHLRVITLTALPDASQPGMLDKLNRLAVPYRWNTRFIPLNTSDATSVLNRLMRNWMSKRRSGLGTLQEMGGFNPSEGTHSADAERMVAEIQQGAKPAVESGAVRMGYYTPAIILYAADETVVNERAALITRSLEESGYLCQIESVNALEAYLGTLPGAGWYNQRRPLVHTRNLADLIPSTSVDAGLDHNPNTDKIYLLDDLGQKRKAPPLLYAATSGATPYRLNLHVDDLGHSVIVGPPGSGKSTLLALLVAQFFRYNNAQVFAFDKGNSLLALTKAVGGAHYNVAAASDGLRFAPLQRVDDPAERVWAKEWLEQLVVLATGGTHVITPREREAISRAVEMAATNSPDMRRMTDLIEGGYLQDPGLCSTLRTYLDGLGDLLDAAEDGLRTKRLTVFEIDTLTGMSEKYVSAVLLYLFHQIELRLDGSPTLLVLDEAWLALQNNLFQEKIREWLKTLRKKNAAVVFATQSVTDITDSPLGTVLRESCPTKIFLPNAEARTEVSAEAYRQMGLNGRQIELLATAVRKRDYYVVNAYGRRMIGLNLNAVALSFLGAGSKEELNKIRELEADYGALWPVEWLRLRGRDRSLRGHEVLDGWADLLEAEMLAPSAHD